MTSRQQGGRAFQHERDSASRVQTRGAPHGAPIWPELRRQRRRRGLQRACRQSGGSTLDSCTTSSRCWLRPLVSCHPRRASLRPLLASAALLSPGPLGPRARPSIPGLGEPRAALGAADHEHRSSRGSGPGSCRSWVGFAGNAEALRRRRRRADRHHVLGRCVLGDGAWTPGDAQATRVKVHEVGSVLERSALAGSSDFVPVLCTMRLRTSAASMRDPIKGEIRACTSCWERTL
eukprot:scaffold1790_cov257-Pinguiococcus_pyrenoidosus.AAC.29